MKDKQFYEERLAFSYSPEKEVELIQVIRTTLLRKGEGEEGDPIRRIEQFWSLEGKLLAENDSYQQMKEEKNK